jgi:hypothetical protein
MNVETCNVETYSDCKLFIGEFGADEFKPFAYYDKHLDCIRVRIRDCSVIEERLSRIFTVLKAAHTEYELPVGFTIKGVRHLLESLQLPAARVYKLTDIIDGIVRVYPDSFVKWVQEEFGRVIEEQQIRVQVDLNDSIEAAA